MKTARPILRLRIAGNTHNPALLALKSKGYQLSVEFSPEKDVSSPWYPEMPSWEAVKDGRHFSATSPVELLGLVAMWETRGDQWHSKPDEPRLFQEMMGKNSLI